MAIVLSRLLGSQYRPNLENELLDGIGLVTPTGQLVGNSPGGEEVGRIVIAPGIALQMYMWLREHEFDVALSETQRNTLAMGAAADTAWRELHTELKDEVQVLPTWYNRNLFTRDLSQQGERLREYMAVLEGGKGARTGEAGAEKRDALRELLGAVDMPALVMDAIYQDPECFDTAGYALLWPPPSKKGKPEPHPTTVNEARAADPEFASAFLAWLHTQRSLWDDALTNPDSKTRRELLERFARFARRSVGQSEDESVRDQPALANMPAFRAHLSATPSLVSPFFASTRADYRFHMQLEPKTIFDPFGMRYSYYWELVEVPAKKKDQEERKEATNASKLEKASTFGGVAWHRLSRTTDDNLTDLQRTVGGVTGTAGLDLVMANALLRYVGTGVRLATEWTFTSEHGSERSFVFPHAGMFIVRCRAVPLHADGQELVRPPSEQSQLVSAVAPEELTRAQVESASEQYESWVNKLRLLEAQHQEHPEDAELQRQVTRLNRELYGSLDKNYEAQLTELEARLEKLAPSDLLERRKLQHQIDALRKLVDRRAERASRLVKAEQLIASFISDEGQSLPLTLEVAPIPLKEGESREESEKEQYYVSDMTTAKSGAHEGIGPTRVEAIKSAVRTILESTSGYGRGHCSLRIDGTIHTLRIEMSKGALLAEAISNITTAISAAAVVAAPFTGGASLAILMPVGLAGAIPSAWRLVDRAEMDNFQWIDLDTAADLLGIVGAMLDLGATMSMARGASALKAGRLTSGLRAIAIGDKLALVGIGVNGLGMVLMSAGLIAELSALAGLPPGLQMARAMEILGRALRDVGVTVGTTLMQEGLRQKGEAERTQALSTGLGSTMGEGTYETGGRLDPKRSPVTEPVAARPANAEVEASTMPRPEAEAETTLPRMEPEVEAAVPRRNELEVETGPILRTEAEMPEVLKAKRQAGAAPSELEPNGRSRETRGWSGDINAPTPQELHLENIKGGVNLMEEASPGVLKQLDNLIHPPMRPKDQRVLAEVNARIQRILDELSNPSAYRNYTEEVRARHSVLEAEYKSLDSFRASYHEKAEGRRQRMATRGMEQARKLMTEFRNALLMPPETAAAVPDYKITSKAQEKITAYRRTEADIRADIAEHYRLTGNLPSKDYKLDFLPVSVVPRAAFVKELRTISIGSEPSSRLMHHEFAHNIEYVDPMVSQASKAFVESRARRFSTSEELVLHELQTLHPEGGYEPGEKAYEGGFTSKYTGKVYTDEATEVVTTGLEHFVSPEEMLSLFRQDPEHFLYVLGVIKTTRARAGFRTMRR
jgi:hypothetical protein